MNQHFSNGDSAADDGLALFRQMGIVIENESILEFGARQGELAAFMQAQGNEVTAVEDDCRMLSRLTRHVDRFVSVGVLQHLSEDEVRRAVAEAARLAGSVLVAVSTQTDDDDSLATQRSGDWWSALFGEHFDIQAIPGVEPGQLILAGDRRPAPASAGAQTVRESGETIDDQPAAATGDFGLPASYTARLQPEFAGIAAEGGVTWQPDVYPTVAKIARSLDCEVVIDIGCTQLRQLGTLQSEFRLVGVGDARYTAVARTDLPAGIWFDADLESLDLADMPADVLQRSVLVCSEVIESLVDPRSLLATLRRLLAHAPALILTTPDRERTYGAAHDGPPPNRAHVRQWTMPELRALMESEGFTLAAATHTRSNDGSADLATTLIVAVNPQHEAIRDSRFIKPAATPAAGNDAAAASTATADRNAAHAADAARAQAMADPQWRARLMLASDDRETLRVLARMSLALGHPDRSMELYGELLAIDGADDEALEGAVLSRMRCGQHAEAARLLGDVKGE